MPKIIKVKCNGPNKCVNEVNLEAVVEDGEVKSYRMPMAPTPPILRDRYVIKCKHCSVGEVVITRQMVEQNLYNDS